MAITEERLKEMEEEMNRFEEEISTVHPPMGHGGPHKLIIGSNTYHQVQAQLTHQDDGSEISGPPSGQARAPPSGPARAPPSGPARAPPSGPARAPPPKPPAPPKPPVPPEVPTMSVAGPQLPFPGLPPPPPPPMDLTDSVPPLQPPPPPPRPAFVPHQIRHRPPPPPMGGRGSYPYPGMPPRPHMGGPPRGMHPPPPMRGPGPQHGPYMPGSGPGGPGMHQGGPGMHQGGPGMHQGGPGMHQGGPGMHQAGPGMHQGGPGMHQGGPGGPRMPPPMPYNPYQTSQPSHISSPPESKPNAAVIQGPKVVYSAPPMKNTPTITSPPIPEKPVESEPVKEMEIIEPEPEPIVVPEVNAVSEVEDPMSGEMMMELEEAGDGKRDKKSKKPKYMRTAAGITWEDPTLAEWDTDDFRVFCGDLGNEVTEEILARAFSRYPSFVRAKVVRDKRTNKTRGYGFIAFTDPNDFVRAMREMNGKYVGNRPIKLRKSAWKERNSEIVKKKEKEKKRLGFR